MKRTLAVITVLVLVSGFAIGKGRGRMGAVKTGLTSRDEQNYPGAGWVVLNTNSEGIVKANVHLQGATPGDTYAIFIVVGSRWEGVDGSITIQENGKGAGIAVDDLTMDEIMAGEIDVRVAVHPESGNSSTGYTSAVVTLPVKPLD